MAHHPRRIGDPLGRDLLASNGSSFRASSIFTRTPLPVPNARLNHSPPLICP